MGKRTEDILITKGIILTPNNLLEDKAILISNGKIEAVDSIKKVSVKPGSQIIEAPGKFIAPGFIDIHVHGGGGYDVMDANYEALRQIALTHSRHGTTSFLPTTMSMGKNEIINSLKSVWEAYKKGTGSAEILGINLEGPYINKEKKGAQKGDCISEPTIENFLEFKEASGNLIRIVTVAPEIPGALILIRWLVEQKIIASVGHSNAKYEQVLEGLSAGLTHVTHTFNAMSGLHHRNPGVVGAVLSEPVLMAELIADGIHVHPVVMSILIKSKGTNNVILITDSTRATDKKDGIYNLGGQFITVKNGEARLKDGTIAGSVLTMDKAVKNIVEKTGASLPEAFRMATINPAICLGIENKKGILEPGRDADIVILNDALEVELTMIKGEVIYKKTS